MIGMRNGPQEGLFDPPGVQWRAVEPQLRTVRLLGLACFAVPLLVAGAVVCVIWPKWWLIAPLAAVAALLVWQAWLIPRRVRAMAYAIHDRDLFLRSGIMFRKLTVVPYVRIQYVDIHVGPIERAFGLASLTVSTASPTMPAAVTGVTPATAAILRDTLTNRDNLTGQPTAPPVSLPAPAPGECRIVDASPGVSQPQTVQNPALGAPGESPGTVPTDSLGAPGESPGTVPTDSPPDSPTDSPTGPGGPG